MTMYEKIKRISRKRGLTLSELNDRAGFKKNVIYSWGSKNPSVKKLKAVADILNVSTDYLLEDSDKKISYKDLTENQKLIAHAVDPDISNQDCQTIIKIIQKIQSLHFY